MYMSNIERDALTDVANLKREDIDTKFGLCANGLSDIPWELYIEWLRQWPKYSGEPSYPVPSPAGCGIYPSVMYHNAIRAGTLYEGEYGTLRFELLAFMQEKCRNWLTGKE